MRIPKHPTLICRMRDARIKHLIARCPVVGASLVTIATTCGNPGCHCHKDLDKHIGHYLTYKLKGKTKTVYVPLELVAEVKKWIAEHHRLRQLSREVSELSIALVRSHIRTRKKKAGRH